MNRTSQDNGTKRKEGPGRCKCCANVGWVKANSREFSGPLKENSDDYDVIRDLSLVAEKMKRELPGQQVYEFFFEVEGGQM